MVELHVKKRTRHDNIRPGIEVPVEDWTAFSLKYRTSSERSIIIQKLILLQLSTNIVS